MKNLQQLGPECRQYAQRILEGVRTFNTDEATVWTKTNNIRFFINLILDKLDPAEAEIIKRINQELPYQDQETIPKEIVDKFTLVLSHYADPTAYIDSEIVEIRKKDKTNEKNK